MAPLGKYSKYIFESGIFHECWKEGIRRGHRLPIEVGLSPVISQNQVSLLHYGQTSVRVKNCGIGVNPNGVGGHIVPALFLDACFSSKLKCWRAQIS